MIINLRSLSIQIIFSFVTLVLLIAAATGLPTIWLFNRQLNIQAWAQVDQGRRASQALYLAAEAKLKDLATLTAQRPTLLKLLSQNDPGPLQSYLHTLRTGAGLDLILICGSSRQAAAQAGPTLPDDLCQLGPGSQFYPVAQPGNAQAWLLAVYPVEHTPPQPSWQVITGIRLDDDFTRQMQTQTGLEHLLLVNNRIIAASVPAPDSTWTPPPESSTEILQLQGQTYYGLTLPLTPPGTDPALTALTALPVANITATQQRIRWALIGGIVLIAAVGSLIGALLARRISQPLAKLTQAAASLSRGKLDDSMTIKSNVYEVTLVAQALEQARLDLLHSLNELRREKEWVEHLLEAIVEGIMTLDDENRITFFSHGAERITGWPRRQVVGRDCDDVFTVIESKEPFSQLIPPPDRRHKITVLLNREHSATLSITGARFMPPETDNARVALVFRDVSEEEAVHRLMGHFLANVAHEFRTPLSALAASVELLVDQSPDLTPAELHELLTSLHLGIVGLHTLVDNLLESASIEAGRFRVHSRPAQLSKIIADSIRLMQPLLDKRNQRLMVELPADIPAVKADPRRLGQVLTNLLSNASKYGPDDSEITIGVTLEKNQARVTVADQGPGILPEYRLDLFRRLIHTAENDTARYGVGLGLSVVKAVVEAHHGQVGVDDRPGGGSVFWFTLPTESNE